MFFLFGVCGPCLRVLLDFVVTLNDHSHDSVDPRLLNFHLHLSCDSAVFPEEEVQQLCRLACEDERGYTRSRDLDLSDLLERFLCSADNCGPADGDEGSTLVKSSSDISSSDSGATVG